MLQSCVKFGGFTVLATLATSVCASAQNLPSTAALLRSGSVSGTIVDIDGIPQMGALVQLLLPDASLVATALTDVRGQYRISNLKPGNYRVRATAALFLPAVRSRLQLATGSRAVVNLTLSTLLATSQWLPATRRTADSDGDWMWALRSSSMRPVLRLVDDAANAPLSISTSATESRRFRTQGRLSVENNSGGFGRGGSHNILVMERQSGSGETAILRADFSGARTPYPVAPSAEVTVGWEKRLPLGGVSRSVLTYTSHPELIDSHRNNGVQTAVLRNAQRLELGDSLRLDVGSALRDYNLAGNVATLEPFLNLAYRPSDGVVIAYTLTQARGLENFDDLDRMVSAVPIAIAQNGRLRLEKGRHDALSLSGRTWKNGTVSIAAYRDQFKNPVVYGTGVSGAAGVGTDAFLADPTTQAFAVMARDYGSTGVRLVVRQPVSNALSIGGEISDGNALMHEASGRGLLSDMLAKAVVRNAASAAIYMDGKIARTGTTFHSGYRWQPVQALTSVDGFHNDRETAYLNCRLRQSLHGLPLMPGGVEAMVSLQNLLAQGYQPFLSSDGQTLYLAQSPRVIQAGLAFTF